MPMSCSLESLAGQVKCVLADPPWPYENKTIRGGAEHHYQTLPLRQIESFKGMLDLICDSKGCHLWLWTTNSMLVEGASLDVMKHWGFKPKTLITWVKGEICGAQTDGTHCGVPDILTRKVPGSTQKDLKAGVILGDPAGMMPYMKVNIGTGRYTRGATEHMLFGVKGRLKKQTSLAIPNVIVSGTDQHSKKPSEAYEMIHRISPGPRFEMFARELWDEEWEGFGDQLNLKDD